jgi:hypothetical protein
MSSAPRTAAIRRTKRVAISIPVLVCGTSAEGVSVSELTRTASVNGHGGLIVVSAYFEEGQTLSVLNRNTGEKRTCTVIRRLPWPKGKFAVGVEFEGGAKGFWEINFPPHATG